MKVEVAVLGLPVPNGPKRLTAAVGFQCSFTSTETVGLLGTGAQYIHLDFHTEPELCAAVSLGIAFN